MSELNERMKLSKTGIEKINHNCRRMTYIVAGETNKLGDYTQYEGLDGASELEFSPQDFKGCVVLTIKEAKQILQSSYDVLSWAKCGPTITDQALNVQNLLKQRIENSNEVNN